MPFSPKHRAWLVAVFAALVAHATPAPSHGCCGSPCCPTGVGEVVGADAVLDAGSAARCRQCAADGDGCPVEPLAPPCDCRLDAGRGEPMPPVRTATHAFDPAACHGPTASAAPAPQRALGVGSDYPSASLAIPIRPARILFGVWRN